MSLDTTVQSHPRPIKYSGSSSSQTNGQKRSEPHDELAAYATFPTGDQNSWYYPSQRMSPDDEPLSIGVKGGNWGNKSARGARWVRRGKIAAWGPGMDGWQGEERARKRLRTLLPDTPRSPSPPCLPHLRSPSPPLQSPFPHPVTQHLSYSSYVMEKAVTHSFRSSLLDQLEHATNGLVEGEATMRRALGRLWQVMNDEPNRPSAEEQVGVKLEDDDDMGEDERQHRLAHLPDLTPSVHRLFLPTDGPAMSEPSHFASPEMQMETLEKSLATIRELQDDGREYVERLEEIREGLGDVRAQRDGIWEMVREKAVKELHEEAYA